ncbi:MAG: IS4 family transposase [Anaerolineae bacterium]|nr:IS4 family transposase [Anaerolineae bacterium]
MQAILYSRANEVAWETGFLKRERILTGSSFVVGLVSGWQADPNVSVAGLSQAIANAGTPITRQGLQERFSFEAVEFMKAMVQESLDAVVEGLPVAEGIVSRFSAVNVVDSSIITLPNSLASVWRGSGGYGAQARDAAVKVSVRWDMGRGRLSHLDLSDGIAHDRTARAHTDKVMAASLQLRDLGYFKLDDFEQIAQQGAYWLSKYKTGTQLFTLDGQPIDLLSALPRRVGDRLELAVQVGKKKRLAARLVAERVPEAVVKQRHERIIETARQNQSPPSQTLLELARWTVILTNVPVGLLTTREVFVIARYRWQIELLFKLWKSDLQIDTWRSNNPHRILCELYAKLIAAIVTHWFLLLACWHKPKRSLRQAMASIHAFAWQWANSLLSIPLLQHTLLALVRALSRCSLDRSRCYPRAFQLEALFCA